MSLKYRIAATIALVEVVLIAALLWATVSETRRSIALHFLASE